MNRERGNTLEICMIILLILLLLFVTIFFFTRFGNKKPSGTPTGPNDTQVGTTEVKVDLLGSDKKSSIVGKTIPFVIPEGKTEIICQPGDIYYTEAFFVKNGGNVKIDYLISISEGTSQESKDFKAAFDFWITTDPTNLTSAIPLVEYRGLLNSGESSKPYYLVISMKTTANNTYQGKSFETVGITVTATEHGGSGQE